jgi:prepilin peptidase CpaA
MLLLISYVLAIAAIDFKTHRIPNVLTFAALVASLCVAALEGGSSGALDCAAGFVIGLALLLPFYAVKAFGAGDVKAMAVVGSFLGWKGAVLATALTLIAGGIIGIGVLLVTTKSAQVAFIRMGGLFATPLAHVRAAAGTRASLRFPYGVAIAAGTIAALFFVDVIARSGT